MNNLFTKRRVVIGLGICLVLLIIAVIVFSSNTVKPQVAGSQRGTAKAAGDDDRIVIQPAKATVPINRDFSFNIPDTAGQTAGKIGFYLDTAELRNEIVVKGQTATAIKGKTFLVINLKLKNDFKTPLTVNTRNFIRLSVNDNSKEWLAPDIHNDPVEVQAISTKLGRVAFPISDTDKILKLQIGEISGDKTLVDLKF